MVLSVLPFFGKARNNSDFECIYRFLINHSQLLVAAIISYDTQSVKKKFNQKKTGNIYRTVTLVLQAYNSNDLGNKILKTNI